MSIFLEKKCFHSYDSIIKSSPNKVLKKYQTRLTAISDIDAYVSYHFHQNIFW